ncbi:MAG: FtsX-like permease family protein, partial [Muribaculaceae bacterium]|nr:FtsX-like permease family protein [Muribaculaceae bacterium]
FWNQPQSAAIDALGVWPSETDFDLGKIIRFNCLVLLTLLLVPALNLSGMIAGRMDSRSSELGVRKSFGATSNKLLSQVLWENLFLTVLGGIFGLIITWIVLSTDAAFVFATIGETSPWDLDSSMSVRFTPDMMFAPAVFIFAFVICVVLNLLSAILPAWLSLRRPIVNSLK